MRSSQYGVPLVAGDGSGGMPGRPVHGMQRAVLDTWARRYAERRSDERIYTNDQARVACVGVQGHRAHHPSSHPDGVQ